VASSSAGAAGPERRFVDRRHAAASHHHPAADYRLLALEPFVPLSARSRQGSDRGVPTFAFGHFRMVAKGDAEIKAM